KPAAWSDIIHDVDGGMGGLDGTVIGAGGGGDRDSSDQPGKSRDQKSDRTFCEHPGTANRCVRRAEGRGTAGANQETGSCRPAASGNSLRAGCGTSESTAESGA